MPDDDAENFPITAGSGPSVTGGTVVPPDNGGTGLDANVVNLTDGGLNDGGFFLDAAPPDAGTVLIPSDATTQAPSFPQGDQIP